VIALKPFEATARPDPAVIDPLGIKEKANQKAKTASGCEITITTHKAKTHIRKNG